jgi:hypothetical protein
LKHPLLAHQSVAALVALVASPHRDETAKGNQSPLSPDT